MGRVSRIGRLCVLMDVSVFRMRDVMMGICGERLVHILKRRRWCLLDETCILATLTSAMGWSVILT